VSDTSRDPEQNDAPTSRFPADRGWRDPADEPVTGAPAGAASSSDPADSTPSGSTGWTSSSSDDASASAAGGAARSADAGNAAGRAAGQPASKVPSGRGPGRARRGVLGFGPIQSGPDDEHQRRRRRWFVAGISVAAAVVVIALCAGALSIVHAVNGVQDRAADAREARWLRDTDCLDLEQRLNRLAPPGSATAPAARATAIRDENAAVRIYVDQLDNQRDQDAWRQLLDARTVFSDALDRQAKSRTPAFYVAPRTTDGLAVSDELAQWSPASCAGPIRRLAAPDL
jgi:hypothetical protein